MKTIKQISTLLSVMLLGILFTQCVSVDGGPDSSVTVAGIKFRTNSDNNAIKGDNNIITKEISISDYNSINNESRGNLIYEQQPSSAPYFRIEIDGNLLQYVSIETRGSTLTVKTSENINPNKLVIYTNSRTLASVYTSRASSTTLANNINSNSLELRASGASFITGKTISSEQLSLDASGASKIILNEKLRTTQAKLFVSGASKSELSDINCTNITIEASGASTTSVSGIASNAKYNVSGASTLHCADLNTKNTFCSASGASTAHAYASDKLDMDASGASKIRYRGDSRIGKQSSTGASSIKTM